MSLEGSAFWCLLCQRAVERRAIARGEHQGHMLMELTQQQAPEDAALLQMLQEKRLIRP